MYNRISLKLSSPPATEPITAQEAKDYLKISFTDDDALIALYITAAREKAEAYTKRAFITQTWEMTLDRFPYSDSISLSKAPIRSVTSIKTNDYANTQTIFDSSTYIVGLDDTARISLNVGEIWPVNLRDRQAVLVTYVAGYGNASTVPSSIKIALLMHVSAMYYSRSLCEMPLEVKCLLDPFKIFFALDGNQ